MYYKNVLCYDWKITIEQILEKKPRKMLILYLYKYDI